MALSYQISFEHISAQNLNKYNIGPKWVAMARHGLKLGQNGSGCLQDAFSIGFKTMFHAKQSKMTRIVEHFKFLMITL